MNERIGTLLNRSGGEFYEGFAGSPNTIKFTEEELQTFAKLIVKECVKSLSPMRDVISRAHAAQLMYKHFGVEE